MTRLTEWFTGLATPNKAIMALVAVGLLAIVGVTAWHLVDALTETAEQKGAVVERAATQGKVIQNVKAAKDARDAVNDPRSCAMYVECVRSARTPTNCIRYLPDHEGCAVQSGTSGGH